ncbi:MAG: phosphate signaling complex protein PhoU [Burkholderiaceae bacterium]
MSHVHTYTPFDNDIDRLRASVTTMGGLVERQLACALDALRACDDARVEQVLADEVTVNQLHVDTDKRCNLTIATRQPAAVDLREIIAVIHINGDLERVGDEAKKIALKSRELCKAPSLPIPVHRLDRTAGLVTGMLRDALDAFVRHDNSVLPGLYERDREVDAQRDALIDELVRAMSSNPGEVSAALSMIFVVQSLERVGDHAKGIAEYVVQLVEGVDLRHVKPRRGQDGAPG